MSTSHRPRPERHRRRRHVEPPPALACSRHSLVLAKRNLIGVMRNPEALIDVTLQPIIFLALFTYIFGGAIAGGSQHDYLQFLLPGILAQTIAFGGVAIGVNLNADIEKGVFDRFRSLPIARAAPLVGAVLGRHRPLHAAVRRDARLRLRARLPRADRARSRCSPPACSRSRSRSACRWVSVFVGMIARTPGAVQGIVFLIMFPLTFGASTFVPVDTLPGWLQSFTKVNPLTHLVGTLRGLMLGGPVARRTCSGRSSGWRALLVVFVPLALRAYRRRA